VWTYPPNVVIGPKLFDIPAEELFFFVIQTYNTSLLYLLFSKPTFHPIYIRTERPLGHPRGPRNVQLRFYKLLGQLLLAMIIKAGLDMVRGRGRTMYMGLIMIWAVPFLMLLWYYRVKLIPVRIFIDASAGALHTSSSLVFHPLTP
jgi:15-cis-phytoene synthase/lycopene beta-cyclase